MFKSSIERNAFRIEISSFRRTKLSELPAVKIISVTFINSIRDTTPSQRQRPNCQTNTSAYRFFFFFFLGAIGHINDEHTQKVTQVIICTTKAVSGTLTCNYSWLIIKFRHSAAPLLSQRCDKFHKRIIHLFWLISEVRNFVSSCSYLFAFFFFLFWRFGIQRKDIFLN